MARKMVATSVRIVANEDKKKSSIWCLPMLLGLTAAAFWPVFQNGYVNWDDPTDFLDNSILAMPFGWQNILDIFGFKNAEQIGNFGPLSQLTFALEKLVFGQFEPMATHGINLAFHLGSVWLVFRLLGRLGASERWAFFGALFFGIHPMRVESVVWAAERKDVLFVFFYMAALVEYARFWTKKAVDPLAKMPFWPLSTWAILAMLSKVQAVSLPLSLLVLDGFFRREISWRLIIEKWFLWAAALFFGFLNILVLQNSEIVAASVSSDFVVRFSRSGDALGTYFQKFFLPQPMSAIYPTPEKATFWGVSCAVSGLFATFWAVWRWFQKKAGPLEFGWLFFFSSVFFMLQFAKVGTTFAADRYSYLPYLGLFVAGVLIIEKAFTAKKDESEKVEKAQLAFVVAAFLAALCLYFSQKQTRVWRDSESLWSNVIAQNFGIAQPFLSRADFYATHGDSKKALEDLQKATAIDPKNPWSFCAIGRLRLNLAADEKQPAESKKQLDLALENFENGLRLPVFPTHAREELLLGRAISRSRAGDFAASLPDFAEATRTHLPENLAFLKEMATAFWHEKQYEKAADACSIYLRLRSNDPQAWAQRGVNRAEMKLFADAVRDFDEAVRLKPDYASAMIERGRAKALSGQKVAAENDVKTAEKLGAKPDSMLLRLLNPLIR